MKIEIIKKNLFDVDKEYHLAHCIASDARMGAGIAVDFCKYYPSIKRLRKNIDLNKVGTCVLIDNVFNLITKKVSTGKPTYETLRKSLYHMKDICLISDIKNIAMPKIGCGLDRLQWENVYKIIVGVFYDTDLNILICVQ